MFKSLSAVAEGVQDRVDASTTTAAAVPHTDTGNNESEHAPAGGDAGAVSIPLPPPGSDVMEIPSLCVSCEDQGLTRILFTRIPFFRDVILMSFSCEHCGYRNAEVQSAEVAEKGVKFSVDIREGRVRLTNSGCCVDLRSSFQTHVCNEIATVNCGNASVVHAGRISLSRQLICGSAACCCDDNTPLCAYLPSHTPCLLALTLIKARGSWQCRT